jgi:hypothetical protein
MLYFIILGLEEKYILVELVVVEYMGKKNQSDSEFHPFLLLLGKIFHIMHPEIHHPPFDHYSFGCFLFKSWCGWHVDR